MKIAIALFDRFTALDAIGPYEVLSRLPGAEIVFVGEAARTFRTDMGMAVVAGAAFADVSSVDVLVVPGGPGTRAMTTDRPLLDWVRRVHPTTQWTTSVCTGSLVLAAAGVLKGVDATTHWGAMGDLAELGANPVQERVVERGKIVTAAGVSAGIDMALWLVGQLYDVAHARKVQRYIQYDPAPPYSADI